MPHTLDQCSGHEKHPSGIVNLFLECIPHGDVILGTLSNDDAERHGRSPEVNAGDESRPPTKKKSRSNGSEMVAYLKERANEESSLKEKDIEIRLLQVMERSQQAGVA